MQSNEDDTESSAGENGLLTQSRRGMLKLTGGGLGAMAVGGTLVGSASAETADGNCVQVDFVTGTSEISDLNSSTYTENDRLIEAQWAETVNNTTEGETVTRTPSSTNCDINVTDSVSINFTDETASVTYDLSNCSGGGQDLLLVSYESPCNGAAGSGGTWDPANADQQAVFDTASVSGQTGTGNTLTVDVPPLPAGVPNRSAAEAYFTFDGTTLTNCITGVDATVVGSPTKNQSGVNANTNNAWDFAIDGDTDTLGDGAESGQNLPIYGDQVTIAGWFRYTDYDDFGRIIEAEDGVDQNNKKFEIIFRPRSEGENLINLYTGNYNSGGDSPAIGPLSTGTWYFVAATTDGSDASDAAALYVYDQNGQVNKVTVVDNRGESGVDPGDPRGEPAKLGMMAGGNREVDGRMDEAYAFSTHFTDSEIQTLYDNSF
jgi:hypothetical protein